MPGFTPRRCSERNEVSNAIVLYLYGSRTGGGRKTSGLIFSSTTRVVEVSVRAEWSGGKQDRTLVPADLRLFDNSKPQMIQALDRVAAPAVSRPEDGGAQRERQIERRSILLFDSLNTKWADQVYARHQAAKALEAIPTGESVAIFLLGNGLNLVQDFTADHSALQKLIARLSAEGPKVGQIADDNPFSAAFSEINLDHRGVSDQDAYTLWMQRQRIEQTFSAMRAIARVMKGVPGQKNLMWLSAAFPLQIPNRAGDRDSAAVSAGESFQREAVRLAAN